jgi:hypothetical protein
VPASGGREGHPPPRCRAEIAVAIVDEAVDFLGVKKYWGDVRRDSVVNESTSGKLQPFNLQSPCTTRTVLYQLHPLHLLYMLRLLLCESAPASGRDALLPAFTARTRARSRARRMKLSQNLCHYCSRSIDAGRLDCDASPRLVLFFSASPSSSISKLLSSTGCPAP